MIFQALATFLLSLGEIILVDLVLSGDNALVIGSAIVSIPRRWRRIALIFGGAAAIFLRILCTTFATFLLHIDYLQSVGGILVLYVTWRLLVEPEQKEQSKPSDPSIVPDSLNKQSKSASRPSSESGRNNAIARSPEQKRFLMALLTIAITDITMSLDNIVVIAVLARDQLVVLAIGLTISIIILLVGSSLVALVLERFPNLIILSGFILAWISADLILQDTKKRLPFVGQYMPYSGIAIYTVTFSIVLAAIFVRWRRARRPFQE